MFGRKNTEMMGMLQAETEQAETEQAKTVRRRSITEWIGGLWLAGRFALLFTVLCTGLLGFSSQSSWASCGHYVQDRFNPAGQQLAGQQIRMAELPNREFAFAQHLLSETPQPCHGPGCRGPIPSPPPSDLALPVQFEGASVVMLPIAEWPQYTARRTTPRVHPESDRHVWATKHEIIKPPC